MLVMDVDIYLVPNMEVIQKYKKNPQMSPKECIFAARIEKSTIHVHFRL